LAFFWKKHHDAEKPLEAWYQFAKKASWKTFADVRRDYSSADQVGKFVVFNIGGNKFRLAVVVSFNKGKIYIHRVMTHKE
jgi:mRNA interferase HigB